MNDQDYKVIDTMERYGGSFVVALAHLARQADVFNLARIKAAWPEYWKEYTEMAEKKS